MTRPDPIDPATDQTMPATPVLDPTADPDPGVLVELVAAVRWVCCHCGGGGIDSYGETCRHCDGFGHC